MNNEQLDPYAQYAAFDFFVTAEHMIDWLYPGYPNNGRRKDLRNSEPLLLICSHIANGSKHFQASAGHHNSVEKTEHHRGSFSNAFSDGFDISYLEIHLTDDEVSRLHERGISLSKKNEVTVLAKMILDYWQVKIEAL